MSCVAADKTVAHTCPPHSRLYLVVVFSFLAATASAVTTFTPPTTGLAPIKGVVMSSAIESGACKRRRRRMLLIRLLGMFMVKIRLNLTAIWNVSFLFLSFPFLLCELCFVFFEKTQQCLSYHCFDVLYSSRGVLSYEPIEMDHTRTKTAKSVPQETKRASGY
jgi:hypothetical protein